MSLKSKTLLSATNATAAMKKKAAENEREEKLRIKIAQAVKKRDSEPRKFPTSFKSRKSRRGRSGSVQRPLRINNTTRSKRTKSLDDIENLLADDMTRHTRAIANIKQNKGTIFDRLQTMPRSIQSEIYSMGIDRKLYPKISSSEVKNATQNISLLPIVNDKRFFWPYDSAWDVFQNDTIYHTRMFDCDDPPIYHNNVIFAESLEEFVKKTKIDYAVKDGCILYRVVPNYVNLSLIANVYDGFIVIDTDDDVLNVIHNLQMGMPWDYVGEKTSPDRNPRFTDRIHTIMRTHFSDIAKRSCKLYRMTWNNLLLTMFRLDTF